MENPVLSQETRKYENMEIKFERSQHEDHLFINAVPEGLLIGITGGWSVGITPQDAIGLAKKGVSSKGRITSDGKHVVLAHGDARLMLSKKESEQLLIFITKASWYC